MGGAGSKPPPPPIWRVPGCCGHLADSYIEGTELEGGSAAHSFSMIAVLLQRILVKVSQSSPSHPQLPLFSSSDFDKLVLSLKLIKECQEIAGQQGQIEKPEQFADFLQKWQTKLEALQQGQILLVPGGWVGKNSAGTVIHIIEKTAPLHYDFITCNVGKGLEYHPSSAASVSKIKYRTSIKIPDIPAIRMLDPGFWSMFFAMWLKLPPIEYHRVEVLYDVLLPWLSGDILPVAMKKTEQDPLAEWRTG
eukprot:g4998.t1